jgi:hypothetical protein
MDVKHLFSTNPSFLLQRLISQYQKQDKLIVAYDFDDTVSPYWCANCTQVQSILRRLRDNIDTYFIVYTSNDDHDKIKKFLTANDIPFDSINENAPFAPTKEGKLFYNVFLDDKAGLGEVVNTLDQFLYLVQNGYIQKEKKEEVKPVEETTTVMDALASYDDWIEQMFNSFFAPYIPKTEAAPQDDGKSRWMNHNGKEKYTCLSCGLTSSFNYTRCPNCDKEMSNGDPALDDLTPITLKITNREDNEVKYYSAWLENKKGEYICGACGHSSTSLGEFCPKCETRMVNGEKPDKSRCDKCVKWRYCSRNKDKENNCPDYKRDPPDGGGY